jgi:hypothetical protein
MRAVRPLSIAVLSASIALLVVACGSPSSDQAARALHPVRLTVTDPPDGSTTKESSTTVHGTVEPADASVQVLGRRADVVSGRFSATVELAPGTNVVDIAATAPDRSAALAAIRVTREMPVRVPDLSGMSPDAARERLAKLGLGLQTRDAGGLLEDLIPGDPGVCQQRPDAGAEVDRGTTVEVLVAKRC